MILVLTAFVACTPGFAQYTPATVPNNKLVDNSYVSNPDAIIFPSTTEKINAVLGELESQTTAQVAVVILSSIGDADIFEFSQELFGLWGVGGSNNNGLVILLVTDVHKVWFNVGYGLEGPLPDVVCKKIQREQMLPSFRNNDYDQGMLNGVLEVKRILTDPAYAEEIRAGAGDDDVVVSDYTAFGIFALLCLGPVFLIVWAVKRRRFADSKKYARTDFPQMRLKRRTWLIEFGGIPLLILILFWIIPDPDAVIHAAAAIYLYYMATILHRLSRERRMIKNFIEKRKFFEISDYLRRSQWYWLFIAIIFPIPFIVYLPFHLVRKRVYRNHPRNCKLCGAAMVKLSEVDDDQHLTKSQQLEEQIKSVDYDIWRCTTCSATEEWRFLNRFSKYKICPACKAVAYYRASNRTLVSPTYSSSGKGEEIHNCKACGKSNRTTYSIAKLTRSESSSSGSSGGGSSSSSGGSWGGGRSGGGGAGSSW